ncbi:hypothetical protein [Kribbella deserti]|uniref:WD40 repeat domain-containing protein n=1 Tax=Kribbella deserti TaxID=1926257 RepID=A0ABV6QFA8_9ACTN
MNALDNRVKQVLTTEADRLAPNDDLVRTAIRRANRIRRGRRAAGASAFAAIGVVLVAFVPAAILNSSTPDPAATPSPLPSAEVVVQATKPPPEWSWPGDAPFDSWLAKLPQGELPRVPYLQHGYLNDGNHRVALPKISTRNATSWPIARVADGWLIGVVSWRGEEPGGFGLLKRSGQFDFLAKGDPRGAALSPDGKQLAYGTAPWQQKAEGVGTVSSADMKDKMTRVAVMDLATRKEISSTEVLEGRLQGWNELGIWMTTSGAGSRWQSALWKPGSKPSAVPAVVAVPTSRSPRMLWLSEDCERVVRLDEEHSAPAEYCGFGSSGGRSGLLSPDGETYVRRDRVAMRVGSKQETPLGILAGVPMHDHAWEDDTHVLISAGIPGKAALIRCDVESGKCERTTNTPANTMAYGPSN